MTKTMVAAAKRIIKSAMRPELKCVFMNYLPDGEFRWCVCSGYVGVRFKEELPLEPFVGLSVPFNMNSICVKTNGAKELVLPSVADVKQHIKINRVQDGKKTVPSDFLLDAELGLWVNPKFLVDIMECLPGCRAWAVSAIGVIYLESDVGEGVLMPVMFKKIRGVKCNEI